MNKFVEARWFYEGRTRPCRVIVWHDMEAPEKTTTAEGVANYFARMSADHKASAHACVDNDSVVICVRDSDTAYAAPGANSDGYQIELAGYARQNHSQWMDGYSKAMLNNAARLAAKKGRKFKIPARWLTDAQLAGGVAKGHTTHAQVTRVFKQSTHTDPGVGFPDAYVMKLVVAHTSRIPKILPVIKVKPIMPQYPGRNQFRAGHESTAALQWARVMHKLGFLKVPAGRNFGTTDIVATRRFQESRKRLRGDADGFPGPLTWQIGHKLAGFREV